MSGFVVIAHRDGSPVSGELLSRLIGELAFRGPDGCDQVVHDWVGLAHQHFWATPEEDGERQPLMAPRGTVSLVFDGRLDNREELLVKLAPERTEAREASDAALVMAAYDRWGERFSEHLLGPFAVAVVDLDSRRVVCARDPLGDRALFYHLTANALLVSSEEHPLLAHPEVSGDFDEERLACYFALQVPAGGATFFREIRELGPGEMLSVDEASVRQTTYWQPTAEPIVTNRTDDELAERFRELLRLAVRCRLRAAAPPMVMLSGGMDSTAAAALGVDELRSSGSSSKLRSISWFFDDLDSCDERRYIEPLVEQLGLEAMQVHGDDALALSHEDTLCRLPSSPEENVYRELKQRVHRQAARAGSRVVWNCAMADALYTGGEHWFTDLCASGSCWQAVRELLGEMRRRGPWAAVRRTTLLRGPARVKRGLSGRAEPRRSWLTPTANRMVAAAVRPRFGPTSGLRAEQLEATVGLRAARGYSLENAYAARQGVEIRDPYRDRRLVEFMLRVPGHLLYRRGRHKHIARLAMSGWLPESILQRDQPTPLTPLFERGLRQRNRQRVRELLGSRDAIWRRYVEPRVIAEAQERSLGPTVDVVLWTCLSWELWQRRWGSTDVGVNLG